MLLRSLIALIIVAFQAPQVFSQESSAVNPNIFGSKCLSQGHWTTEALAGVREIVGIAQNLKNDPKCNVLAESFNNSIPNLQAALQNAAADQGQIQNAQRLFQEMKALSQFSTGASGVDRSAVTQLLLGRAIGFSVQVANDNYTPVTPSGRNSESLAFLAQRLGRTTNVGLGHFNNLIKSVAENQECVMNASSAGTMFAASVNILSSFVSSGQTEMGLKLSESISNLFNAFRQVEFSKVIRRSNEIQLMNSISCLLESTAETYCSARDARQLFEQARNSVEVKVQVNERGDQRSLYLEDPEKLRGNGYTPLRGFYILTQMMPVVTDWLLKALVAANPQLVTDADFRNGVLDNNNEFLKQVNSLNAVFRQRSLTIEALTSTDAQVTSTIELIMELAMSIRRNQSSYNFFVQAVPASEIPFLIAGVQAPLREISEKGNMFDEMRWFQGNRAQLPVFRNPTTLLTQIRTNLDNIIARAQVSAINYYNQWAIMDKQVVLDNAMLGVNFNVIEILRETNSYLENLYERLSQIQTRSGQTTSARRTVDPTMLGSILDTQMRLRKILAAYEDVSQKSRAFAQANENVADIGGQIAAQTNFQRANFKFLEVLYYELNVLLSRTGFLSSRLANYVQFDFESTARDQANAGLLFNDPQFENSLRYTADLVAFNQMISVTGSHPAAIRQDLANALNISKLNLQSIEQLFKDFMIRKIAELKIQRDHPQAGRYTVEMDTAQRMRNDHFLSVPTEDRGVVGRVLDSLTGHFTHTFNSFWTRERYATGGRIPLLNAPRSMVSGVFSAETILPSNTEFNSAGEMYSQYCIQSLAFNDLRGIWYTCLGAKMESPFIASSDAGAREAMEKYLNVIFEQKALEDFRTNRPLNESKRICALREYYRRNTVLYLTKGLRPQDQREQRERATQDRDRLNQYEERERQRLDAIRAQQEVELKARAEAEAQAQTDAARRRTQQEQQQNQPSGQQNQGQQQPTPQP